MAACFIDVGRVAIFQKGNIMEGDNQAQATEATATPAAENTTAAPVTVTESQSILIQLAEVKEKYDGQQKAIAKIVQHLGDMRISGVSIEIPAALTELLGG